MTETRAANAGHRNDGTDTNRTGTTRSNPNQAGPGRTTPARNGVTTSRRTAPTGPAPVTWATVAPWMSSAPAPAPTEEPEPAPDAPSPVPFADDHDAVLDTLDSVDQLAVDGASEALLPLARDELHRLTGGLRALLDEHRPDENGRCPVCPSGMRARRWPCQVWRTAHQHLIGENADPAGRTNRAKLNSLRVKPRGASRQEESETSVPVHPTKIVASGDNGPSSWETDAGQTVSADADTDVFEWPTMDFGYEVAPAHQPRPQPPVAQPQATQPPVGGHLETDHTRIHRASVVSRRDRSGGAS